MTIYYLMMMRELIIFVLFCFSCFFFDLIKISWRQTRISAHTAVRDNFLFFFYVLYESNEMSKFCVSVSKHTFLSLSFPVFTLICFVQFCFVFCLFVRARLLFNYYPSPLAKSKNKLDI